MKHQIQMMDLTNRKRRSETSHSWDRMGYSGRFLVLAQTWVGIQKMVMSIGKTMIKNNEPMKI